MRRQIPLIITSIAGLAFAVSYFIPHAPFGESENLFGDWVAIVQSFAIWLGALNLVKISWEKVSRKREGWQYAIIVVVSLAATIVIGMFSGFAGLQNVPPTSFRDAGTNFDWVFVNIYTPLTSTMFSMLAFFVASASYRAFRARNLQATLLLLAGFLVMGGRVPLFDVMFSWATDGVPVFSQLADWIMSYPNAAGQRAIMIGIALGIMSSSLRVLLGIERSHIGGGGS